MPGKGTLFGLLRRARAEVFSRDDLYDFITGLSAAQTVEDVRCQRFLGILQLPGGRDDPAIGHLHGKIVASEPGVEFRPPLEPVVLPAHHVIVHSHLGIPVGDIEEVVGVPAHTTG